MPGLIEGAHEGHGLGTKFLAHLERTKVLVHVIDISSATGRDPVQDFEVITRELEQFLSDDDGTTPLAAKPQLAAANKIDALDDPSRLDRLREHLSARGIPLFPISAVTGEGIGPLLEAMWRGDQPGRRDGVGRLQHMTIGLLGGTFDPIHVGHLDVARAARSALGLDAVWLVPARTPPHRRPPHVSAAHRFAMAALAIQAEPGVLVSDLEMDADGPSFTTATLDRLEARGWDLRRFCFVIGADAFREIELWKDYPRLLDRCHFAVVSRRGIPATDLRRILPSLAARMVEASASAEPPAGRSNGASDVQASILLIDAPTSPVSSTDVRQAIANGAVARRAGAGRRCRVHRAARSLSARSRGS